VHAFRHHDFAGVVSVCVTRIASGTDAGYDALPGLSFDPAAAIGYPSMSATVTYEGTGYRRLMGWVQAVHTVHTFADGTSATSGDVDSSPAWHGLGMPFLAYGYPSAIFDAPANNLNGAHRLEWQALHAGLTGPACSGESFPTGAGPD
jgi:hypothetical protein